MTFVITCVLLFQILCLSVNNLGHLTLYGTKEGAEFSSQHLLSVVDLFPHVGNFLQAMGWCVSGFVCSLVRHSSYE
jgi:hypothetical protein